MNINNDTIAAVATPVGSGGIGIIRISGPCAFTFVSTMFVPKNISLKLDHLQNKININMVQSHKLYYGHIVTPNQGIIVDEVLVVFMKAPNTYTTEDIVEIQSHSGFIILNKLLSILLGAGARLAEPGEFTKRAFLNGRIDLTQAEGIINLINARTNKAATIAAECIKGSSRIILEQLRSKMCKIKACYEVNIEFTEPSFEEKTQENHYLVVQKEILPTIKQIIKEEREKVIYQHGVEIVITGAPNAGKSSLMNRLLKDEKTIVTNIPGTTRNLIKEHMIINDLPVILYDTAGIHNTSDAVELIGINKSRNAMNTADMILLVIDAYNYEQFNNINKDILSNYRDNNIVIILNKIDICKTSLLKKVEEKFVGFKVIKVSAKKNLFIENIRTTIFKTFVEGEEKNNINYMSLNSQQYFLLNKIKIILDKLSDGIIENIPIDIASYQLGECIEILDKILGTKEDASMYDYIFNKFCIGK